MGTSNCYRGIMYFSWHTDLDDIFAIGEMSINDNNECVQKAISRRLREAGILDTPRLNKLLYANVAAMPFIKLRYASKTLARQ